jgi:hypothetical protein
MQIGKRSRAELKQYFVKNAIPTESNFAELIDGMLNQKEDGIAKLPNDALSIEAAGDDTSQKNAIHFYNSFSEEGPIWVLSLNPRQDPLRAATARPGFSISDSAGNSRLFIDRDSGNVGLGTVGPLRAGLHVDRGATDNLALMLSSSGPGWGSGLRLENTAAGAAKTFGIYVGGGALHFADVMNASSADRLLITQDGDVGIGTPPSAAKLQVAGTVRANRFTSDNMLVLNDYTTVNPPSNVYLYSAPSDRDAWLYLDSADTRSNWGIYHRQLNDAVKGLPGKSIGFIGGGTSKLQAYISLGDGSAHFAGQVTVSSGALIQSIGIGTQVHGPTEYPYETIQMNPAQNLRIWFGTNQRFTFSNAGILETHGDIQSNGSYIKVRGKGNEQAFIGGDGEQKDVHIGSNNADMTTVIAWNEARRTTMLFSCLLLHQTSDARLKENIGPLTDALDRVSRLRGVGFNWKNPPADKAQSRNLGLIAQEVRAVVPEAVSEGRGGHLGINYAAITVLLLEAVKEQQKQIDELRGALKEPRAQRKKGQ